MESFCVAVRRPLTFFTYMLCAFRQVYNSCEAQIGPVSTVLISGTGSKSNMHN